VLPGEQEGLAGIKQDEEFANELGEIVKSLPTFFHFSDVFLTRRQFLGFQLSVLPPRSSGTDVYHIINSALGKSASFMWSVSFLNTRMYFQGLGVVTMVMYIFQHLFVEPLLLLPFHRHGNQANQNPFSPSYH